jgi:hypothetical protein
MHRPINPSLFSFNTGFCLAKGNGAAKDPVEAAKLYTLAAAQGLAFAQHSLGKFYPYIFWFGSVIDADPHLLQVLAMRAARVSPRIPLRLSGCSSSRPRRDTQRRSSPWVSSSTVFISYKTITLHDLMAGCRCPLR